ncbi:MAG TPA: segregation and condensation protein A [Gammaproteobacteria bacterium]|nr:segregation and condensation protein A [Gammaproteobacteria bacterium]
MGAPLMATETESKEQRILRMVKKVITDIAKDTYTPPGMRHPLSDNTINTMRVCLDLIVAREAELAAQDDNPPSSRPRFVDEPSGSVIVQLKSGNGKPGNKKQE